MRKNRDYEFSWLLVLLMSNIFIDFLRKAIMRSSSDPEMYTYDVCQFKGEEHGILKMIWTRCLCLNPPDCPDDSAHVTNFETSS